MSNIERVRPNRERVSNLPERLADFEMPNDIQRVYANINRLPVSDEVKANISRKVKSNECSVDELDELNNFFDQMNIASIKPKDEMMNDLDEVMRGLNIHIGGTGPAAGSTPDNAKKRGIDEVDEPEESQAKKKKADPTEGMALLVTALNQPQPFIGPIDQRQPISFGAIPQPTQKDMLVGYATQFYNQIVTKADECIKYVWTDTLKASLSSYVVGKLFYTIVKNPLQIMSSITSLIATLVPYAAGGSGIVFTTIVGLIVKKVFSYYANNAQSKITNISQELIHDLKLVEKMTNEAVVDELKLTGSKIQTYVDTVIKDTQVIDTDALANILDEINANLDKEDTQKIGEIIVGEREQQRKSAAVFDMAIEKEGQSNGGDDQQNGNGKRKSKKRQTKNKKNKARKTKKNKRSSKKKAYKKK